MANFITRVERMPNCTLEDGKIPLLVAARDAQTSEALVTTAQKCLTIDDGIEWKRFGDSEKPIGPLVEHHFVDTLQEKNDIEMDSLKNSSDEKLVDQEVTVELKGSDPPVANTEEIRSPVKGKGIVRGIIRGIESLLTPSRPGHKPTKVVRMENEGMRVEFPSIPLDYMLETELSPGFTVSIIGRPAPFAHQFTINLCSKSNIALHFNVRLRHSVVVRNTFMSELWGPEERDCPHFPFAFNQTFTLNIVVESDQYVIGVDGQPFCIFEHRIPFYDVNKISVIGDIVVNCMTAY